MMSAFAHSFVVRRGARLTAWCRADGPVASLAHTVTVGACLLRVASRHRRAVMCHRTLALTCCRQREPPGGTALAGGVSMHVAMPNGRVGTSGQRRPGTSRPCQAMAPAAPRPGVWYNSRVSLWPVPLREDPINVESFPHVRPAVASSPGFLAARWGPPA